MSIDFDPVKVGPGRRRVEPIMVGVLAVLLGLIVAIVKPWQPGGTSGRPPPRLAAATASAPAPDPSPTSAAPLVPLRTPTWQDLEPAITTHDAWGVRVIFSARRGVKPDPRVRYMEDWTSAVPSERDLEPTTIERDERSIVALGITHPPDSAPGDVQVWRVGAGDELVPIDARPLDRSQAEGALLLLRFGVDRAGFRTWDAGRYRIGMITGDGVRWIVIEIPERPGGDEPPTARPTPEPVVVPVMTHRSFARSRPDPRLS